VSLILLPGFCLSGFGSLLAKLMTSKSKNKALTIVLLTLFASCMLSAALGVLAISGAFNTISYHLFLRNLKHPDNFKK
jgi:Kef-type K+ transport system membrane component KefB